MKKLLIIAVCCLAATVFSSCGASYSAAGVNVSKVDELALLQPLSLVYYYPTASKGIFDQSLTDASESLVTSLLTSRRYPFTDEHPSQ